LTHFIKYEYEEDIQELLIIIYTDLKLIPKKYSTCLSKFLAEIKDRNFIIEKYYATFIAHFLLNVDREDFLSYKIPVINILNYIK